MNRQEAHDKVKDWIDIPNQETTNVWHFGMVGLHKVIDEIYDNIENNIEKQDTGSDSEEHN